MKEYVTLWSYIFHDVMHEYSYRIGQSQHQSSYLNVSIGECAYEHKGYS